MDEVAMRFESESRCRRGRLGQEEVAMRSLSSSGVAVEPEEWRRGRLRAV